MNEDWTDMETREWHKVRIELRKGRGVGAPPGGRGEGMEESKEDYLQV